MHTDMYEDIGQPQGHVDSSNMCLENNNSDLDLELELAQVVSNSSAAAGMVSVITEKLQRQRLTDELRVVTSYPHPVLPATNSAGAAAADFTFVAPAPVKMVPPFRKASSFDSAPAPMSCPAAPCAARDGKENFGMGLPLLKDGGAGPQLRGLLGRVPGPLSSDGLPQFSARTSQRPHTSFSATAGTAESPRPSPPLLPPKRHCRSLSIPGEEPLPRPIALRPGCSPGSRPGSSRSRASPRNLASPYHHHRRSAFTPTPRASSEASLPCESPTPRPASVSSGFHEPSSVQSLLECGVDYQASTPTPADRSHSQPCFELTTPPPLQGCPRPNLFVFGLAGGRSCLPRIASSPTTTTESSDVTPTNSTAAAESLTACAAADSGCSDAEEDEELNRTVKNAPSPGATAVSFRPLPPPTICELDLEEMEND